MTKNNNEAASTTTTTSSNTRRTILIQVTKGSKLTAIGMNVLEHDDKNKDHGRHEQEENKRSPSDAATIISATGGGADSPTLSPTPSVSSATATPTLGQSVSPKIYPSSFNSLVLVEQNSKLETKEFNILMPTPLDRVSQSRTAYFGFFLSRCNVWLWWNVSYFFRMSSTVSKTTHTSNGFHFF